MKYGYTDRNWNENTAEWDKVCSAITMFNREGFQNFMNRKTCDEKDIYMINCMEEMVAMMKRHAEEIKK